MKEQLKSKVLNDVWLKASVTGSLWASFEIIAGSLLHNLHIPFSGSILTVFAIILLISFTQLWPVRGLIWRAGLICALMKSVSPSAVILGPMIGIFTEALLIEIVIFIAGRNFPAYLLGGALAMLSSLVHKLINLLIIYGFNLVDIYTNFYNYVIRQLGISGGSPENLIYGLALIYLITGIFAALTGIFLGRKAVYNKKQIQDLSLHSTLPLKTTDTSSELRIINLAAHILVIPLVLYAFSYFQNLLLNIILTVTYFIICITYYRHITRRLLKPYFWLQLSVIILLTALFLESSAPGDYSIKKGMAGGLEMFMRAILIIIAFSAISAELLNPVIRKFLVSHGFERLYISLQLSFSALPSIIEHTSGNIKWMKNPVKSISGILNDAENWLDSFKRNMTI